MIWKVMGGIVVSLLFLEGGEVVVKDVGEKEGSKSLGALEETKVHVNEPTMSGEVFKKKYKDLKLLKRKEDNNTSHSL